MRKRTVIGTLLTIAVTLLLTGLPAVVADDAIEVVIDIKPCKDQDPDVLNVNAIGWLPVAIFVDSEIESGTVTLHVKGSAEPYIEPAAWGVWYGYPLAKFNAEEVINTFDPLKEEMTLTLVLEGQLADGTPFWGEDDLKFFKRGNR